jgi:hypothetical protein
LGSGESARGAAEDPAFGMRMANHRVEKDAADRDSHQDVEPVEKVPDATD